MGRWLVACAVLAMVVTTARAQPTPTVADPVAPAPWIPRCKGVGAYLGTSVLGTLPTERANGTYSPVSASLLVRMSGGLELRHCRGETSATHLRLGPALTVAGRVLGARGPVVGLETEVNHPITPKVRLGVRLGVDPLDAGNLYTFGLRVHLPHRIYVALDGFSAVDLEAPARARRTSAMVGVGFEGRPARYLSIVVLLIAGYGVLSNLDLG